MPKNDLQQNKKPGVFSLLKPYRGLVILLILFALISNSISLWLPKIISHGIDDYIKAYVQHFGRSFHFDLKPVIIKFSLAILLIFIFAYLQSIIQTYSSEKVARDLRGRLSEKISKQSNAFIDQIGPSKLLTNLTGDVDSIKMFVSQALVSIIS